MPSAQERLARIDERTEHILKGMEELKKNDIRIFQKQDIHNARLSVVEAEHKKPFHQGTVFGLFRLLFGK